MEERKHQYKKGLQKGAGAEKRAAAAGSRQRDNRDRAISAKRGKRDEENAAQGQTQFSQADIIEALQQLQSHTASGLRTVRRILSIDDPPIHLVLAGVPVHSTQSINVPSAQSSVPVLSTQSSVLSAQSSVPSAQSSQSSVPSSQPLQSNQNGIVSTPIAALVYFLKSNNEVHQLDAAWCITNLATGTHEQTESLLPAAPYLIQLLSSSNLPLVEQAAWALGNLSADCLQFRDVLRANGILPPLVSILQRYTTSNATRHREGHSLARTAAFALANQARGQNPKLEQLLDLNITPIIAHILGQPGGSEAMSDAGDEVNIVTEVQIEVAWILTYITAQITNTANKMLIDSGLLPLLVHHLSSPTAALVIPILRSVGNIISRSDPMTDILLHPSMNPPLLPILQTLFNHEHRAILKEAAYVVSNIAGGPQAHVDLLVGTTGMVGSLARLLMLGQFDIAREAAYAVCNIASNSQHIELLVREGVAAGMLNLLGSSDSEVIHLALTLTEMVLKFHPQGTAIIQQENGIEKLEALQMHDNHELYRIANQLIDEFFGEDFEDSECAPEPSTEDYPSWRVRQV